MKKGSGTRSGLLWEVERILYELKELNALPQILLMENVTQVHGAANWEDFNAWKKSLANLGYCNFWQDLIATDYGIPQTRDRTFMVSILGDYNYNFPKPIKLKHRLRDLLETNVAEKYFLSDKMIEYITADNDKWTGNNQQSIVNKSQASTINTAEGQRRCDASNYICDELEEDADLKSKIKPVVNLYEKGLKQYNRRTGVVVEPSGSSTTLLARFQGDNNMVAVEDERQPHNKALRETFAQNEIPEGVSMVDAYNRKVRTDGTAKTITTRVSEGNEDFVAIKLKRGYECQIKNEKEDTDDIDLLGNYSKSDYNATMIVGKNGSAPTVRENHGQVTAIPIKNATKKGYLLAEEGDGVDISTRMESHRGTVQKGMAQTLSTMGGANTGVVVSDERK